MDIPKEALADIGLGGPSHLRCLILIAEQEAGRLSERRQVGRIWEQDARAFADLVDDPADPRADDGPPLPHSLRDGQPEPFRQALLHDDGGVPLQRVNHGRVLVDVIQRQRNQQDACPGRRAQILPLQQALPVDRCALGVVTHVLDRRANQHQVSLTAGRDMVGEAAHDSGHVLEPVPAGDLDQHPIIEPRAALAGDGR